MSMQGRLLRDKQKRCQQKAKLKALAFVANENAALTLEAVRCGKLSEHAHGFMPCHAMTLHHALACLWPSTTAHLCGELVLQLVGILS